MKINGPVVGGAKWEGGFAGTFHQPLQKHLLIHSFQGGRAQLKLHEGSCESRVSMQLLLLML